MEKLEKFYKKIKGAYFAFMGAGVSITSIFIALFLYMVEDPTFSPYTHYISNLGEGPNYSNYIFNIGSIISGILLGIFYLYLTHHLIKDGRKKLRAWSVFIVGFIASIGQILAGLFPMYTASELHYLGAAFYFIGIFFLCILYGLSEFSIKNIHQIYLVLSIIVVSIIALFSTLYVCFKINPELKYLFLLTEWLTHFAIMVWIITQGIYTLKVN